MEQRLEKDPKLAQLASTFRDFGRIVKLLEDMNKQADQPGPIQDLVKATPPAPEELGSVISFLGGSWKGKVETRKNALSDLTSDYHLPACTWKKNIPSDAVDDLKTVMAKAEEFLSGIDGDGVDEVLGAMLEAGRLG